MRQWWWGLGMVATLLAAPGVQAAGTDTDDEGMARVIVRYREGSTLAQDGGRQPQHAARLARQLGLALQDGHALGARTQSLRASGIGSAALAARLAARSDVEWAVPVRRKTVNAVTPNDPYFPGGQTTITPAAGQWYLRAPDSTIVSAVNALGAWAITTGSPGVTVAVLDTGVRGSHPDLSSKLNAGYDFVSRTSISNDGSGVDNDPTDPGDYSSASDTCGAGNSSWHGTQVSGLIAAATDNGIGIAGTGRDIRVQMVRVLGKCGGYDDDIQAGMRWAGGLSNASGCTSSSAATATCNPTPAQVINMSLGGTGACTAGYRTLIAELNAAGVSVIVAAGNDAGQAVSEPANCDGAIAVAGLRHSGTKVGYSNLGPEVSIAAPAGNCVNDSGQCLYPLMTTTNSGTTTPGSNTYSSGASAAVASLGTSFATPIVAGTVGLMLSANGNLTPAQVKSLLRSSARSFPTTGAQTANAPVCQAPNGTDQIECYCTTTTCGAGMLDAASAVSAAAALAGTPTAAISTSAGSVTVGSSVTLSGSSSTATSGRSIASYGWALTGGAGFATLNASSGASVTLTGVAPGSVTVQLTVVDSAGVSDTALAGVVVTAVGAPTAAFTLSPTNPTAGATVALDAAGSTATTGRTITGYQWQVTSGGSIASFSGSTTGSTATLATSGAGSVTVQLTVTDSAGATGVATQTVTVSGSSTASSGDGGGSGGGALGLNWLAALALAGLALGRPRRA